MDDLKKATRVEIWYDDGTRKSLEGESAVRWQEIANRHGLLDSTEMSERLWKTESVPHPRVYAAAKQLMRKQQDILLVAGSLPSSKDPVRTHLEGLLPPNLVGDERTCWGLAVHPTVWAFCRDRLILTGRSLLSFVDSFPESAALMFGPVSPTSSETLVRFRQSVMENLEVVLDPARLTPQVPPTRAFGANPPDSSEKDHEDR